MGSDAYRCGGQRRCDHTQIRTDLVDLAVGTQVRTLLDHPERLVEEYQRRLDDDDPGQQAQRDDLAPTAAQIRKWEQGIGRLSDRYAEGVIEKAACAPRLARLKERGAVLETQAHDLAAQAALESDLRLIIGHLDDFATTMRERLDQLDRETQRGIRRPLVKRVEIEQGRAGSGHQRLQDWTGAAHFRPGSHDFATLWEACSPPSSPTSPYMVGKTIS